jgi:hypothetical protein
MPNNNKKTRGSNQHHQGNPGVSHESNNSNRPSDSSSDRSQGNSDRVNQGMGDHGTSRRSENIDSGSRSNNR